MIKIGLTGWGDHQDLYVSTAKDRLRDYSAHFPVVELDTSFYALYTYFWDKTKSNRIIISKPLIYIY